MKPIALLIAIGLILAGIITYFLPPAPCMGVLICLNELMQTLKALFIIVPGIVLLIFIPIANSRYRILATIGIWVSFILAATLIGGMLVVTVRSGFNLDPIAIVIGIVAGLGFLCAALSAVTGKDNAPA